MGGIGYWANHSQAWCVSSLTLGCQTYTKSQIIGFMLDTTTSDMTYRLAAQLAAAKLNVEFLKDAADLVYSHHEKFDGTGYPRGLRGEEIPFGARIFAIVDTVDAMIYKRPYNNPVSFRVAAAEVRRCTGTQFDPSVVEATLAYLSEHIPRHLL